MALVDENVLYEVIREWRVIKGECVVTMLLARKALVSKVICVKFGILRRFHGVLDKRHIYDIIDYVMAIYFAS